MRGVPPCGLRAAAFANPKPLLTTATFRRAASGSKAKDGMARDASVVKTKRVASAIRPGWITGLNSPEMCDQNTLRIAGKSARARQANNRG